MSQAANFVVPTAGPATPQVVTTRMNSSLDALLTSHSGSAHPTYAQAGTIWMDTSTAGLQKYYHFDGTNDVLLRTVSTATGVVVHAAALNSSYKNAGASNYSVVAADAGALIDIDANAADRVATLPLASSVPVGFPVTIRKSDTSFKKVTINRSGSDTIKGATSYVFALPFQTVTLMCIAANAWAVVTESGTIYNASNANGDYTRWADGTQECWRTSIASTNSADVNWPLPISFAVAPTTFGVFSGANDANYSVAIRSATATTSTVAFSLFNTSNARTVATVSLQAKGRWFV